MNLKMTVERSKCRSYFLTLVFITKNQDDCKGLIAKNLGVAKIQRELWHTKQARKVSGLLRNRPRDREETGKAKRKRVK